MYMYIPHRSPPLPSRQSRLREEVWAVCGKPESAGGTAAAGCRAPTYEDLGSMPQLGWVIQEALRLYPPAPNIARTGEELRRPLLSTSDLSLPRKRSRQGRDT